MDKPKKPNKKLQHERELRGWSQARLAEKLGTTIKRVSLWECGDTVPDRYYQEKLCDLFSKNAQELGFHDNITIDVNNNPQDGNSKATGTHPQENSVAQTTQLVKSIHLDGHQPIQLFIPNGTPHTITIHIHQQAPVSTSRYPEQNDIIDIGMTTTLGQERPRETEGTVKRREFFQEGLRTGAAILTSYALIDNELLDRFSRALKRPSTLDERTLNYFELRTEGFWQDRYSAALASKDLLSYVLEHLQKVLTLLEGSLYPSVRTRLCSISSGIAQLAGHLLFDMSEFARARNFHQLAIAAAQEGNNQALEAVAWGRMSFTWTYSENPLEALRCIQEARRLAEGNVNTTVRAYLAAVEAEVQAILGSSETCLKALEVAERVEDRQYAKGEMYWLHFDRSRLAGYQGICFKRLYHPGDARTRSFLNEAQKALTDALTLLDSAKIQRRSTFLIDIAGIYAQQGDVEGACGHAIRALSIMAQTKSQTATKRLLTLRQEIEAWKDTQSVKNLDGQIASLLTLSAYRGIA